MVLLFWEKRVADRRFVIFLKNKNLNSDSTIIDNSHIVIKMLEEMYFEYTKKLCKHEYVDLILMTDGINYTIYKCM